MSDKVLYIELPPYLAQWFVHENGGQQPVTLERHTTEHRLLKANLMPRPSNVAEPKLPESYVEIAIPEFKNLKDIKNHDFLPRTAREELASVIRDSFIIQLMRFLHRPCNIGRRKDQLIEAWMEDNGIEFSDTNWNALAKIYQRQMVNRRVRKHREKKKAEKKRVNKC